MDSNMKVFMELSLGLIINLLINITGIISFFFRKRGGFYGTYWILYKNLWKWTVFLPITLGAILIVAIISSVGGNSYCSDCGEKSNSQ